MTIFFIAIIIQLIDIQYFQKKKYTALATELTIRQDTVFANKGNVYAADGNLLATSMSKFTIRMDVVAVDDKDFNENVVALSNELSKMLGKPSSYYLSKLKVAKKTNSRYLLLARNIGYTDYLKMKEFPNTKLTITSHCDRRETDTYNIWLSKRRMERTIGYLVNKGIPRNNIAGYFRGEREPDIKCTNCTEEEYTQNRRTTIQVTPN